MKLGGQMVLVTGARSDIGEAIARRFAVVGSRVWVTGRHPENIQQVAAKIIAGGGDAAACVLDESDPIAVAARVADVVKVDGKLDVMVANAALAGSNACHGLLLEVSDEQWRRIIDVNLSGVFYCARESARAMAPRGRGCIVTIGSINSFTSEANVPASAAAKGGTLMYMKSLARDLGLLGIRVNGIAPKGTDTPRMLQTIADAVITLDELTARFQFGRRPAPDEIVAVALFLASEEAS